MSNIFQQWDAVDGSYRDHGFGFHLSMVPIYKSMFVVGRIPEYQGETSASAGGAYTFYADALV